MSGSPVVTAKEPDQSLPAADSDNLNRPSRWVRRVVLLVLVTAAAIFVWDEYIKYRVIAKRFGTVVPGKVYRSGQISQWMIEKTIRKHQIAVIVDLNGVEPNDVDQQTEIDVAERLGVELHRFPLGGNGTGDIRMYAEAISVIDRCVREGKPVLVHCAAGAQRTGGVIATYRMLVRGDSPSLAYEELQQYGWAPDDDYQLRDYVNAHMEELALLLVEMGVIERMPQTIPTLGP